MGSMNVQSGSNAGGLGSQAKPDWSQEAAPKTGESAQAGVASEVQKTSTVQESDKSSLVSKIKAPETWSATMADLKAALAKLGFHRSDETTQQLALLMMQYGIELSEDNFDKLQKMLKGRDSKQSLQSAVVAMSKGVGSSVSVSFLNSFFQNQTGVIAKIQKFQQALATFQSAITSGKAFDQGILQSLGAILMDLNDQLNARLKKIKKNGAMELVMGRESLLKDMYSLHQLLSGLQEKYKESTGKLSPQISSFKKQIRLFMSAYVSQSILSQESEKHPHGMLEEFVFWQLPNILGVDPNAQSIDVIIKKDPKKKSFSLDEQKTKIVIGLETPDLGKMSIELIVMKKKVWYTFRTEDDLISKFVQSFQLDLKKQMESFGYELSGFQSLKQPVDVKKMVIPTRNLDDLVRINAEV